MPSMRKHQPSPMAAMRCRRARADEPRHVDHGGVDGDGVAQVAAVFDHLHQEGLAAGHVEGVDEALHDAEGEDPVDGDACASVSAARASDCSMRERLRPDQQLAAVEAVDPDAGEGREEEGGNLAGEADDAEQQRRAGEPVDQPAGGDAGHPRADERDALAAEEEPEVAVAQGAPGMGRRPASAFA